MIWTSVWALRTWKKMSKTVKIVTGSLVDTQTRNLHRRREADIRKRRRGDPEHSLLRNHRNWTSQLQFSRHFFVVFPKCPGFLPKGIYWGGPDGYILNVPLWVISGTPFQLILNFTSWEHCSPITGDTAKNSLNEPLRDITGTFFGKIWDVPVIFPMGTLRSHDLGHCKCTAKIPLNEPLVRATLARAQSMLQTSVSIRFICPKDQATD